jgi:hypothetical protein
LFVFYYYKLFTVILKTNITILLKGNNSNAAGTNNRRFLSRKGRKNAYNVIYDKQDQQEKAVFSERNPHTTQQQERAARSPGGPQTKTGNGTRQITDKLITQIIHKKK